MITYTEKNEITTKIEVNVSDMIGWSILDCTPVYKATVTEFSIARGLIAIYIKILDSNYNEYKCKVYRNVWNGFTEC